MPIALGDAPGYINVSLADGSWKLITGTNCSKGADKRPLAASARLALHDSLTPFD